MSEPGRSSIPTSADRRSNNRPTKKRALNTPSTQQSAQLSALFANPDREIKISSTSTALGKSLTAPPEIVTNVQGSSAGAGSGEFHVYKASRRREYERLRRMDEEVEREEADAEFERKREEARKAEEEKLGRNRARREKMKARRAKGKVGWDDGGEEGEGGEGGDAIEGAVGNLKRKLGPRKDVAVAANGTDTVKPSGGQETSDASGENGQSAIRGEGSGITIHDDD